MVVMWTGCFDNNFPMPLSEVVAHISWAVTVETCCFTILCCMMSMNSGLRFFLR